MKLRMGSIYVALLVSLGLSISSGHAQAPPSPSEGLTLPDQSVTTQDDSASVEVNPAGLGFLTGTELSYAFVLPSDDFEGVVADGHALFFGAGTGFLGFGLGVQWLERPELGADLASYQKYTLGTAIAIPRRLSFGAGVNYFGSRTSERLNDLVTWDFGFQWRPSRYFGAGAMIRDANFAFLDEDEALPRRVGAGFALRGWDGRLVLDTELMRVQSVRSLTLSPRLLIEPLAGLRLFGRTDILIDHAERPITLERSAVSAGLELSLGSLGVQGAAFFQREPGNDGWTVAAQGYRLWLSPDKQRSLYERRGRWVRIDLDQSIAEQATSSLLGPSTRAFLALIEDLDSIAEDPGVEGVVFRVGATSLGYAQMWEFHQQVERIREAGKTTISIVRNTSTREVYLASAADEIWLMPYTAYMPTGINVQFLSYQPVLENVGIQAEFVRIGDYKSAPERFIKPRPSDEALEQTEAYIDTIFAELIDRLAERRGVDVALVREMFDRIPLLPHEALAEGFIDRVVYTHEAEELLRDEHGVRDLERGYRRVEITDERWGTRPEIAIVYIDGMIVDGRSGATPFSGDLITGSETIARTLRSLADDDNVKAVVLRVDSGGGSASGSDVMFRELRRLTTKKPVIASMGNIAASGGYYAAAGADEIFATPTTLTGSIGIFAGKFNIGRLAGAIGVNMTPLQRGERSGIFSIMRPWSEEELAAIGSAINFMYQVFLEQVASTRPLTADEVDAVGRGRVWTGTAAREQGLVDHQGGILDAIRRAEVVAGLEPRQATYNTYPGVGRIIAPATLLASVSERLMDEDHQKIAPHSIFGLLLKEVEASVLLPLLFGPGEILMLPPCAIVLE
ncbi:MAG: signal peptide peptidase SppA [Bradymonadaceae bacterium]